MNNSQSFKLYQIKNIENNFNNLMLLYEIDPIKTNTKYDKLEKGINDILSYSDIYKKSLYGFNSWACILSICSIHLTNIYYKKQTLVQMEEMAKTHILKCLIGGIGFGFLIGNIFGKRIFEVKELSNIQKTAKNKMEKIKNRYYLENQYAFPSID